MTGLCSTIKSLSNSRFIQLITQNDRNFIDYTATYTVPREVFTARGVRRLFNQLTPPNSCLGFAFFETLYLDRADEILITFTKIHSKPATTHLGPRVVSWGTTGITCMHPVGT